MSDLGRVVVLSGGLSHEREVSLRSGRRVAEALRGVGVEVEVVDVDSTLVERLLADPPAVVFPALHGASGEDGALREVLELLGLRYVGAACSAARTAFDKPAAKEALRRAGLSVPDGVALPVNTFRELGAPSLLRALTAQLSLPLFVKPAKGGSALGATRVDDAESLPAAMVSCFAYGDVAVVERFIAGTEVAVTVIDTDATAVALPAVEIVPDGGVYDYPARYTAGMTEFFTPARLSDAVAELVARTAVAAHRALGLRDLSRADLIVTADDEVVVLEVNVAPGMTETSLLPMAAEAAGLDLGLLYRDLAQVAADRPATDRSH